MSEWTAAKEKLRRRFFVTRPASGWPSFPAPRRGAPNEADAPSIRPRAHVIFNSLEGFSSANFALCEKSAIECCRPSELVIGDGKELEASCFVTSPVTADSLRPPASD